MFAIPVRFLRNDPEKLEKYESGSLLNILPAPLRESRMGRGFSRLDDRINYVPATEISRMPNRKVPTLLIKKQIRDKLRFWDIFDHESHCSNPRDLIYGILAVMGYDAESKVDYSESSLDTYWKAGELFRLGQADHDGSDCF